MQDTVDEILGRNRFIFLEDTTTASINDGEREYTFDTDVQAISDFSFVRTDQPTQAYRPTYVPYRKFVQMFPDRGVTTSRSLPSSFSLYGRKVLLPSPLDADITASFMFVKASPTLSSDAATLVIPIEFKQIYIRGAQAGVEEYRENYDQAAIHRRKVEDLASDMLLRYGPRQFIRPGKSSLRGVSNYGQK